MICATWRVARSSVYARQAIKPSGELPPSEPRKRGPRTAVGDEALVIAIRQVLESGPFHTEGHRKVRRLRARGIHAGKHRVLRLMRRHRLLAPTRAGRPHGDRAHSGTIKTSRPNELWGTHATRF
jgi:putative transposase